MTIQFTSPLAICLAMFAGCADSSSPPAPSAARATPNPLAGAASQKASAGPPAPIPPRATDSERDGALRAIERLGGTVEMEPSGAKPGILSIDLANTAAGDDDLYLFKGCNEIQTLDLHNSRITDHALPALRGLINIKELLLHETSISDDGLVNLAGFRKLENLSLGSAITDAGLKHVADLPALKFLHLNQTRVSDAGLYHLSGMIHLQALYLRGTGVSDDGLEYLVKLVNLRTLDVRDTKLTPSAIFEFEKNLPRVRVLH